MRLRRALERAGVGTGAERRRLGGGRLLGIEAQIAGPARADALAAAQDVLGRLERADEVVLAERLDQAAQREVRHREIGRLAGGEQAGDAEIAELRRDREAGIAVGELEIDQSEIGPPLGDRGERADPVLGDRGDAVERIQFDQMPERLGEQRFVLDDQNAEHDGPSPQPFDSLPKWQRRESRGR